ncbi:unnamed protein product [Sympodiomycopsis kandeliae]
MAKLSVFATLLAAVTLASSVSAAIPAHLHPKRHLFERSDKNARLAARQQSGNNYPPVLTIPNPKLLPQAWKDALKEAVKEGKIPDIPVATLGADGNPSYPAGTDPAKIGSWTLAKIIADNDVAEAPDNVWAVGFDDGPTDLSPPMYDFLQEQGQAATHFMIGSNIVSYPNEFDTAAKSGGQLAVHTWSHKLQSANTNEEILGDLAWTMQIIYDRTGRIPNLWRPPQGDVDNRVRAVAEEVLGLQCVLWKADSNDWCLDETFKTTCPADNAIGQSYDTVHKEIQKHINGPKSPGVILLEHEIHSPSIALFKEYYPTLKGKGWNPQAVGEFSKSGAFYSNARNNTSPTSGQTAVVAEDGISTSVAETPTSSSGSSSASASSSKSTGSSGNSGSSSSSGSAEFGNSNASSSGSSGTSGALSIAIPAQFVTGSVALLAAVVGCAFI